MFSATFYHSFRVGHTSRFYQLGAPSDSIITTFRFAILYVIYSICAVNSQLGNVGGKYILLASCSRLVADGPITEI